MESLRKTVQAFVDCQPVGSGKVHAIVDAAPEVAWDKLGLTQKLTCPADSGSLVPAQTLSTEERLFGEIQETVG